VLYPKFRGHGEGGLALLGAELGQGTRPQWTDPPLNPSWEEPDAGSKRRIETAQGLLAERFAFTQTMPLADFVAVAEGLRKSGYRPTRFRPYAAGKAVRVAAIWTRDGRDWQTVYDLDKEQMARHDEDLRHKGYVPEDVAGYLSNGLRYAAIWVAGEAGAGGRRLSLGVPVADHQADFNRLVEQRFVPTTVQVTADMKARLVISQVYAKVKGREWEQRVGLREGPLGALARSGLLVDVSIAAWGAGPVTYAAIQDQSTTHTCAEIHGVDEKEHLARCKVLVEAGYRPASITVNQAGLTLARMAASVWHRPAATDAANERLAERRANAAVALLRMNRPEAVWPLLKHGPDPRVRSYLVHRLGPLGADAGVLVKRLEEEPDVTIRRALLLSLGEFGEEAWTPPEKKVLVQRLQETYSTASDPGLHAAAEWLLRQWREATWLAQTEGAWAKDKRQREKRLEGIRREWAGEKDKAKPQWYVNGQGQTMVVIPGPVEFLMGSPPTEEGRQENEIQHRRRIGRTFAIAAKPVTVKQYREFSKGHEVLKEYAPTEDCPAHRVDWYMAAAYCNWLSDQDGIPKGQWCYETTPEGRVTKLRENYLSRTGYRLPTEAEWEYASRAGAVTSRCYGESEELLKHYAWYSQNAPDRSWPVGGKKPNDLGLFDLHGNVWAWCLERYKGYPSAEGNEVVEDREDLLNISDKERRVLRGGAFGAVAVGVRSALRNSTLPSNRIPSVGFRPARTFR
jgi:formylglycine-generating enzyme required for sulfatase activity